VRKWASVDWNKKESVRAKLRIELRKILKKHVFPPYYEKAAVDLVLAQAESLGINITEGGSDAKAAPAGDDIHDAPRGELPYPVAFFDGAMAPSAAAFSTSWSSLQRTRASRHRR